MHEEWISIERGLFVLRMRIFKGQDRLLDQTWRMQRTSSLAAEIRIRRENQYSRIIGMESREVGLGTPILQQYQIKLRGRRNGLLNQGSFES
jgi:hypothetical protein